LAAVDRFYRRPLVGDLLLDGVWQVPRAALGVCYGGCMAPLLLAAAA